MLLRSVAVIGTGQSKFGRRNDARLDELAWESLKEAMNDAGVTQKDIDAFVVSTVGGWSAELLPAVVVGEYCGLEPRPTMRVEAACASGSAAVFQAYSIISSGQADVVAVLGVEKMTESPTSVAVELIGRAGNYFWEFENFGMTFPGYYALYATAYISKFGAGEKDLAEVAVKNHYYGSMNPKAQFQKAVTIDEVMASKYVAWPLKLLDCSPITDGSASVILASDRIARRLSKDPIWIRGIGGASGTANMSLRDDFVGLKAARLAAKSAYQKAGFDGDPKKLDLAEVHDCFTIAELLAYEDLGFSKKGEGFKLARDGQTYKGGKVPVNLSGGLKAKGHPIGATGVSMMGEVTRQLRSQVKGERQADIKHGWGLIHNIGGTGHYAYVTLLSQERGN